MCFFFQAEDGIRDLVRSRGLGDVYKRQPDPAEDPAPRTRAADPLEDQHLGGEVEGDDVVLAGLGHDPVSYTHLTLPTSDLV